MRPERILALAAGLLLLAAGTARADTVYKIEPVVRAGDTVAGIKIPNNGYFQLGALNDQGQLVLLAQNAAGGEALLQYEKGQHTLIAARNQPAPAGRWPGNIEFLSPMSMNEAGTVVFGAIDPLIALPNSRLGLFQWSPPDPKVTPLVLRRTPAVGNRTFGGVGYGLINNRGETAFIGLLGSPPEFAVLLRGQDGQIQPVAIPGDPLPWGGTMRSAFLSSFNDAGVVGLQVVVSPLQQRWAPDAAAEGAYIWEKGTLTRLLKLGDPAPGGGAFVRAIPLLNNQNRNVLVAATVSSRPRTSESYVAVPNRLYLFEGGEGPPRPVLVPDQPLPGGGKFRGFPTVQMPWWPYGFANSAGQRPLELVLDDGSRALYQIDAEGQLSLLLKEGTPTDLGKITRLGANINEASLGVGLNRHGQIAVPVRLDNGPATVALLTPVTQ